MAGECKERRHHKNVSGSVVGLASLIAVILLSFTPARAVVEDRIVANVNGEIVLLSEVKKQIALLKSLKSEDNIDIPPEQLTEKEVLRKMIDEKIMAHYAKENNVTIKDSEVDQAIEKVKEKNKIPTQVLEELLEKQGMPMDQYRDKLRNQMLISRIMAIELPNVTVTDAEAEAYYKDNPNKFLSQEKVKASHIVILAKENVASDKAAEARGKIEEILRRIRKGADFVEMAKKYSEDATADGGGDLGWFARGKMIPVIEDLAFSLQKGEVGGPIRSSAGFHIMKVTDREEPKTLPFDKVSQAIKERLEDEMMNRKRSAWLEQLRSQAYIEILY